MELLDEKLGHFFWRKKTSRKRGRLRFDSGRWLDKKFRKGWRRLCGQVWGMWERQEDEVRARRKHKWASIRGNSSRSVVATCDCGVSDPSALWSQSASLGQCKRRHPVSLILKDERWFTSMFISALIFYGDSMGWTTFLVLFFILNLFLNILFYFFEKFFFWKLDLYFLWNNEI